MSLLRQLLVSVSLAIFIILAGAVWLSTHSAREYLNTQLQIQTDSAAASLALTLSQPSNQDAVTQELIIAALFDTGQFNRIELSDTQGKQIALRSRSSLDGQGIPQWFTDYAAIEAVRAAAQVSDGWRQVGQVVLVADPGYALKSLWDSFIRIVGWVVAAGILWAVFVFFLIRWLRRMLHEEVTKQLDELVQADGAPVKKHTAEGDGRYSSKKTSTFIELQEVTQAIASARQSILATAEERHAKIESLELELNQDSVTGLANRKYFINELRRRLDAKEKGWVFIFRLRDLADINKSLARPLVDDWLFSMSQSVLALVQQQLSGKNTVLARLNGSDFVLLVPTLNSKTLQQVVGQIQQELMRQRIQLSSGSFCRWALAKTDFAPNESFSQVLSRLDLALMRAESAGHGDIEVLTKNDSGRALTQLNEGESQWRARLQNALAEKNFSLALSQRQLQGQLWNEATLTLNDNETNSRLSAFQFMPVATRLGLSGRCDLQAIQLALQWLVENKGNLVVRVSLPSLTEAHFLDGLAPVFLTFEDQAPLLAKRLYIELDAFALDSALPAVQHFAAKIQPFGVHLGVRRVLSIPQVVLSFAPLQISYARVDPDALEQMVNKPGGKALVRALWDISKQAQTPWIIEGEMGELSQGLQQLLHETGMA